MNCMKCGREVDEGQVFCDDCLESMEQEPINMNTPVLIPAQPPMKSSPRRPVFKPEDELKWVRDLNKNLCLVVLLLSVTVLMLLGYVFNQEVLQAVDELGKNYNVIETVTMP